MISIGGLSREADLTAHILIVDDEPNINDLIRINLEMIGHTCVQAADGEAASRLLAAGRFGLVLLDILLPGLDGYQLLPLIMKHDIPVIFLTAKDSLADKVKGLSLGADDYITKPFEAVELLARIEALLRRTGKADEAFVLGAVEVRLKERRVTRAGKRVELTPQEFALLETLIVNCNLALTREQLLNAAWGYGFEGESRTVDIHIQRLRNKLGWEDVIKTIYKYGYRLER